MAKSEKEKNGVFKNERKFQDTKEIDLEPQLDSHAPIKVLFEIRAK